MIDIIKAFIEGFMKTFTETFLSNPIYIGFVIFGILCAIFYSKIIGFMGEFWVKTELWKLSKKDYIILNNIMIYSNNTTHQIDHIVISKYGIFVIETKNYSGLIVGKEYSEDWTQYLGKQKYYFKNPIHQNYGHIKALSEVLNISEDKFISIISLSNRAKVKVTSNTPVVQLDFLVDTIKKYHNEILDVDINTITNKLNELNIKDKKLRKEHVKNIKTKIKDDNNKVNEMICPKCGGTLVVKNGKYGSFIGCSNYPKCHFTKNL